MKSSLLDQITKTVVLFFGYLCSSKHYGATKLYFFISNIKHIDKVYETF